MKPCHFFQSRASYDKYLESLNIKELEKDGVKTIKGERVRSLEECAIANYLYVNGVEYEYERRYEHDMADEEHGNIRLIFTIHKPICITNIMLWISTSGRRSLWAVINMLKA